MAWMDGILLDRDAEGNVVIGDNVDNPKAEEFVNNGEPVFLTNNGEIITVIFLNKESNCIEEMLFEDWNKTHA